MNKCLCASKTAEICCPSDGKLRKEWLLNLEKEHKPVRKTSREIIKKLKLLSNSHRVEILLMLEQREHCMDEMARKLNAQKSAVSYHLGMLERRGLVCKIKRSRFAFYSLSQEGRVCFLFFETNNSNKFEIPNRVLLIMCSYKNVTLTNGR